MQGRRDRPAKVLGRALTIPPDQTSGQMQHHVDIEGAAEPQTMPRGEGYFDLADTADADRFRCRRHFARLDLDRQECSYPPTRTKRGSPRQRNTMFAFSPCRRATAATDAPGSSVSATTRRLNAFE